MGAPVFGDGPTDATFTIGAQAGDVINVAVQLVSGGSPVSGAYAVQYYLSSDAAGQALGTDPGTVAIGSDGTILAEHVDDLVGMVVTETTGTFDLDVTDADTGTLYLNVVLPNGRVITSGAITHA
jgi:hypothetical protein